MNLFRFALNNIKNRPFRSGLAFLFVALVVLAAIWTTLILQAVRENLRSSLDAMQSIGADIVVVPRSSSYAYLQPGNIELNRLLTEIAAIPGVDSVSPQLRLFTADNSPYCSEPVMYVSAIQEATDFTVQPWLPGAQATNLGFGEAYAGSSISIPPGYQNINLAGKDIKLVGQLARTGTNLDQSLYVTFETAKFLADSFKEQKVTEAGMEANYVPVIMVDVTQSANPKKVSNQILKDIPGVSSFESANFFQTGRKQMSALLKRLPAILVFVWLVAEICIGLIFTISVNERKREWGVLRVLGSSRKFLLRCIVNEGVLVALAGGMLGFLISLIIGSFFIDRIARSLNLPLTNPTPPTYAILVVVCLVIALSSVTLASIYPAWLVSRQDPAVALRG